MIGGFQNTPPVTKNLIIINALLLLGTFTLQSTMKFDLTDYLGLHFLLGDKFNPLQYITYLFMHGGVMHLVFNMFALFMFGRVLEEIWGGKKFFAYFVLTGIGAAILHTGVVYLELMPDIRLIDNFLNDPSALSFAELGQNHKFRVDPHEIKNLQRTWEAWQRDISNVAAKGRVIDFMIDYRANFMNGPTVVGASGSVYGILLAFGFMFPNARIMLLIPPIPMKAKYFVIIFGVIELFMGIQNNPNDNVAHYAHLGGMIFGFLLLKYWKQRRIQ